MITDLKKKSRKVLLHSIIRHKNLHTQELYSKGLNKENPKVDDDTVPKFLWLQLFCFFKAGRTTKRFDYNRLKRWTAWTKLVPRAEQKSQLQNEIKPTGIVL